MSRVCDYCMRKKSNTLTIAIIVAAVILIIYSGIHIFKYICFISTVDTEYTGKMESALESYDIDAIDECLKNAEICFGDRSELYTDCRENIEWNMGKRNYTISMYGGGDNIFRNGIQEISVQVYGRVLDKDYGESSMKVYLKMTGAHEFEIIRLESGDEILERLFCAKN